MVRGIQSTIAHCTAFQREAPHAKWSCKNSPKTAAFDVRTVRQSSTTFQKIYCTVLSKSVRMCLCHLVIFTGAHLVHQSVCLWFVFNTDAYLTEKKTTVTELLLNQSARQATKKCETPTIQSRYSNRWLHSNEWLLYYYVVDCNSYNEHNSPSLVAWEPRTEHTPDDDDADDDAIPFETHAHNATMPAAQHA